MPAKTRPHRSLPALLIVIALVVAGSPAASARTIPSATLRSPDRVDAAVLAVQSPRRIAGDYDDGPALRSGLVQDRAPAVPAVRVAEAATETESTPQRAGVGRAAPDVPAPKAKSESTVQATSGGSGSAASFSGRNRVWIPALGIKRSVTGFACTSNAYPGDRVYKWGCAGRNNVYLFGHAHSVFKPLHDMYVRGRLKKGMKVYYADGKGRVSTYAVIWWKVTTPDKGAFAYAAQSKPSMTLQTCVGARSQYRLIVRLTKVG